MKIELDEVEASVDFCSLEEGETFVTKQGEAIFMKIWKHENFSGSPNAVALGDGDTFKFPADKEVIRIDLKVVKA